MHRLHDWWQWRLLEPKGAVNSKGGCSGGVRPHGSVGKTLAEYGNRPRAVLGPASATPTSGHASPPGPWRPSRAGRPTSMPLLLVGFMGYDGSASTGSEWMTRGASQLREAASPRPPGDATGRIPVAASPTERFPEGATRSIARPFGEYSGATNHVAAMLLGIAIRCVGMAQRWLGGRLISGMGSPHTLGCRNCISTHGLRTSGAHFLGHPNLSWDEVFSATIRQG